MESKEIDLESAISDKDPQNIMIAKTLTLLTNEVDKLQKRVEVLEKISGVISEDQQ